MKKNLFVSIVLMPLVLFADVDRIQALRFDRGTVRALYLAPGLGSIVFFPCALLEVFVGRSQDLKAQISPSDKKTLFLNLRLNSSLPTNFIARCEGERNVFVFDIIPSRAKHQDVIEIRSSYGGAGFKGLSISETSGNRKSASRLVLKSPVLVEKGGGR